VFDEFVQIENPLQRRVKGTGLGLPLSKRLAELLGGSITVDSQLGVGSTFRVTIPLMFTSRTIASSPVLQPGLAPVLVVEDSDEDLLLFERALSATRFQMVPARSAASALTALSAMTPAAIVLDLRLQGHDSWDLIARLKRDDATRGIPLVIASAVDDSQKGFALGADAYGVKPIAREWLLETLDALVPHRGLRRVLVVDDEETARFIIRELLGSGDFETMEAASGREGLRLAREVLPDIVLLDLRMTDMSGVDVYEKLQEDDRTARLPVVLITSGQLSKDERHRMGTDQLVLAKQSLTRESLRAAINQALTRDSAATQH
jgi:CheY-like chemotaxis protein